MRHTTIIQGLEAVTPFVGPEALERRTGHRIRLRLGANESPFGASPAAIAAILDQLTLTQFYGDPEGYLLRQRLAGELGVPSETIVLGSGIDELLSLCCRVLLEPGDCVVTTMGSYPTFDYGAVACGAVFHRVAYKAEMPDLEALADTARDTVAKVLYLANPDNPSGAWHSPDLVRELRSRLPAGCILFLDEAYHEFASAVLPIDQHDPQVIRFRTFSKAHGMAGLRVGYVVAHPHHTVALNKIRMHFGVSCIAQAAALASLDDPDHVRHVVAEVSIGRDETTCLAHDLGLRALPSHTNFVTVDVGLKHRAEQILEALLAKEVFIRKPGAPPLDGCIRITVGTQDQRAQFAEIFRHVVRAI